MNTLRGKSVTSGLGLITASLVAALASSSALAQDTAHVKWLPDGKVELIPDAEYGSKVVTTQEELGTLFGPGKKPFEGQTITIHTLKSGPHGGVSGPLYEWRPVWEDLSGGKMNIVETPFGDVYPKMMLDLKNGTGNFDATMVGAFWYGDIVPNGFSLPIDDMRASGKFPKWDYDGMPDNLKKLYTWNGVGYGVTFDADAQELYYRRDVLTDPKWAAEFEKEYGYKMPVPPTTWQQVLDISKFFNGKNWDSGDAEPDSGTVLHLKVGEQGHFHYQSLSASFAITPGDKVDSTHNVYWFDPVNMKPLINSPGHVKALEFLGELNKTGPAAQTSWSLGEAWDYFLRGKSVFVFSWADVGALCQDTKSSKIKGKCATAMLPGSTEYYDMEKKEFVKPETPNRVGNNTGGSWHGVISAFSKSPEATYSFLSLMAIKPVSKLFATRGWDGPDPAMKYQMLEPKGEMTLAEYEAAGWDATDVKDYVAAIEDNFSAKTRLEYLRIPGTFEYWDVLDKNLSAYVSGQMGAQAALDATAKTWDEITDRIGRDAQIKAYSDAIGYKP